jgi:hypothetical protein
MATVAPAGDAALVFPREGVFASARHHPMPLMPLQRPAAKRREIKRWPKS